MLTSTQVKSELTLQSVQYSTNAQAVGLFSVAAILSLIMWYIFSFLTLFMNKYTLDALQAEPFLFCEYLNLQVSSIYFLCYQCFLLHFIIYHTQFLFKVNGVSILSLSEVQ